MTRNLTALMFALILIGFGAVATAEPAASEIPSAQPQLFMSQGAACPQIFSSTLVPAPIPAAGCQGGLYGSCDRSTDCKGYPCPLGEIRYCFGGTGSGCLGSCGCW